nr:hypothetical protein [Tanacetum cinerariifolium]
MVITILTNACNEKICTVAAGSRDRQPMLATRRYAQWRSRFLRYIDTRPNDDALRKCILEGPYTPITVVVPAVPTTEDSPAVLEHTTVETLLNMSPENKVHYESEKEAIHLILFVTIVKQQHKLDEVSYHKLFDFLKQYQKEVNELRAERIARNANPLALVPTTQPNQDPYYQIPKSHKSYTPTSKPVIPTRSHATTRNKGKEIAKPITPLSESASEEDSDPEQAQRDKDMQKKLALITRNDNQSGQFGSQRTVNVVGVKENVGKKGVPLQAKQSDWLADTDEEIDEQEFEAHYSYMAKIQEVPTADSVTDFEPLEHVQNDAGYNLFSNAIQHFEQSESINKTCVVETDDSNVIPDSPDMCDNDIQNDQNDVECDDEQCKSILAETSRTLGESNSIRYSCLVALQSKQTEFEKYKACNDRTVDYDKLERLVKEKSKVIMDLKLKEEKDIDKMISMKKQLKFLDEIVYKRNQSIQTIHMLAPKGPTYNGRPTFANPRYLKQAQSEIPCLYAIPNDQSDHANKLIPDREETLSLERESRSKLNEDLVRPYDYTKLNTLYENFKPPTQEYEIQLAHANEIRKKMWRKSFVKYKQNIFKNINLLPVSKSVSKSRQVYNVMTNNINHFNEIVDQAWIKHSKDHCRAPTAQDMDILIKTCLMPLALKTHNDSFIFVHEL